MGTPLGVLRLGTCGCLLYTTGFFSQSDLSAASVRKKGENAGYPAAGHMCSPGSVLWPTFST